MHEEAITSPIQPFDLSVKSHYERCYRHADNYILCNLISLASGEIAQFSQ